ncbi:porin [Paraburkholderia caribensis]|uniref:porin n=1 Tax=Paraburkholderia caribensis TaxID=75105 RepID=UPI00159174B2|nr:porin [Paraburkholderia caribensis]
MKKFVSVVAMTSLYASFAHASSSVTLYGIIDPDVVFVSNAQLGRAGGVLQGAHQISMLDASTSSYAGSRFGLKGVEDLGGGTSAVFTLENGFNAATGALGQGGLMFGRQAFVGVTNNTFGAISLGRQYSSLFDFVSPSTSASQFGGFITSHPDDLDNLGITNRQNNTIKISTPSFRGFSMNAMYGLGGVAGNVSQNQLWSVGAGYLNGPFRIGVAFLDAFDPNISLWGAQPNSGGVTTNNMGSFGSVTTPQRNPVIAGYASAHREQIAAAGTSYVIGRATVGVVYSNTRFVGLGSTSGPNPLGYVGSASFNTVEGNLTYLVDPDVSLGTSYSYTSANGPDGRKAHYNQVNVGAHYFISKRTDVYVVAAYQRASGVDSLGQSAVASITGMTPSASKQQFVNSVGLAHKF